MKILNGNELVDYIKERQIKQARALRLSWRTIPRLAIVRTGENEVIDVYMRLKQNYGSDVAIEVDIHHVKSDELIATIEQLNADETVHGIVVQLPLENTDQTAEAVNAVSPDKDVDGLGENTKFTPATAQAIDWLLAGYNVELNYKKIAIIGRGRLVGAPLFKLWKSSHYDVEVYGRDAEDLSSIVKNADIIVTATGTPGLITSEMLKEKAVVVDAGTASENGKVVGDLAEDVRTRNDLTITPIKGGVGPLTITALFENVILAARKVANIKGQQDI